MSNGKPQIGMFDGTRGRGDGSSPWGLHDTIGGADELVFACEKPDETCGLGSSCPCHRYLVPGDLKDVANQVAAARIDEEHMGGQGVRCARVVTDDHHGSAP